MAAIWILSGLKTAKTVRFILSKLVRKRLNHGLITILCAVFASHRRGALWPRGGLSGKKIGIGRAHFISGAEDMHELKAGEVLVADMTDPDWEPIMKRAAAIVTRRGGRTCHAAIIARELGVPAIVGCGDSIGALQKMKSLASVAPKEIPAMFMKERRNLPWRISAPTALAHYR